MMGSSSVITRGSAFFAAVALAALAALATVGTASAADTTVWMCKPGQADNPCIGNVDGPSTLPDGSTRQNGYVVRQDAPVDCFYVYPTQSEQETPNADLSKDKELVDVTINQARQFSRVCDVYAPVYRQYTLEGLSNVTPEMRDIAYADVLKAWNDYLENYNRGRGVIVVGHSQGSSHLARLINEEVDRDAAVRDRLISAIIPGANVYAPIGRKVGGQFLNVPACEAGDQIGCVIAYSMFQNEPPEGSRFGRVESGYWVNPNPRPDPALYEVLCVNPGNLLGKPGTIDPLADLGLFTTGSEAGFLGQPDYYRGECMKGGGANWLNVSKVNPSDPRLDLADIIATSSGDLHTGDINLALDTLVGIAQRQSDAYVARERRRAEVSDARARRPGVAASLAQAEEALAASQKRARTLSVKLKKAKRQCKKAKRLKARATAKHRKRINLRKRCRPQRKLNRKLRGARGAARAAQAEADRLRAELAALDRIIAG